MLKIPSRYDGPLAKTILFSADDPTDPKMVLMSDANEDEKNYANASVASHGMSQDIGFFRLNDVLLRGAGYIFLGEEVIADTGVMVPYVAGMMEAGQRSDATQNPNHLLKIVEDRVLVFVAEAPKVYGHWLLDYLPRLWLSKKYIDCQKEPYKIIIPNTTPLWAKVIFRDFFGLSEEDFILYDPFQEDVVCRSVIIPTFMHKGHRFHIKMNEFIQDMIDIAFRKVGTDAVSHEKVFLSRHQHRGQTTSLRRGIDNETEIMDIARDSGFLIFCPEEHSWDQQIRVLSRAKVIVGEAGSALHNSIFAPKGAVVGTIPPKNHVQASIGALRGHSTASLSAALVSDGGNEILFQVDPDRFAKFLTWLPREFEASG